ncbi:glycosyltransferase 87 family protein [Streptomyces sp. NPDC102256]|uniref:glycosyltransferase 87 family protein n=1 Tax=unclassified Streptomyces TaxID=2593676 RepID=UPI00224FEE3B|nr:glycosyltransferase 87 family protein [Streptomyces sp. NBC_00687]MCX4916450.1 glycosyltransferase 87 family protein [Streptomyces sp. NBC_00687]
MRTGKSDISGWLVRRASWHAWAVTAVVLCAHVAGVARASADGGMDNAIVVRAARTWLDGGSPYADRHFLYLPSAVLAAVPQAVLPDAVLRALVPLTVTALLLAGWVWALRIHGVPGRSRLGVLGPAALALGFAPFGHLVSLGNWTVTAAAALPLALLLAARERWGWAGVVVGAAVALKPLLAPVALLFVFARRWPGLAAVVLVPAAASGGAALLMPDPTGFVTRTLPFLLRGHDTFVTLYEASPAAVLPRLGVPGPVAVPLACAAAAAGVVCAYRRWSRGAPGPLRLVETAVLLMLSAFLVSRPSYDHYLLVVVPLLLAGLPYPDSVTRGPWFWLALVPQVPGADWPWLEPVTRRAFRDCFTLVVTTAAVVLLHRRHQALRGPGPFVAQRQGRRATRV